MSKVGYARVSSQGQNLARQTDALENAGCDTIFSDKKSGKDTNRPELQKMLDYIHKGDEVVIYSIDRLGRNMKDNSELMQDIKSKGATLSIINLPTLDGIKNESLRELFNTFMIELMSYMAESERDMIKERQSQGIKLAKERGVYKGRKKKLKDDSLNVEKAIELLTADNDLSMSEIAEQSEMSRSSLYRLMKDKGITRNKKAKTAK